MAKKVGKCINIDCDNYKKVVEVAAGEEFECPMCHQPLEEVDGGGKKSSGNDGIRKKIIIATAAVALLGGGAGLYFGPSGDNIPPKDPLVVDSIPPKDVDSIPPQDPPVVDSIPPKKDPKDDPKNGGDGDVHNPMPKPGYGTVNLGYGRYTGYLKNGLPHGQGTITYTQSHRIVNSKDFVANPGDTFEGDFRDGRISSIGYWFHDGNQTAVKP